MRSHASFDLLERLAETERYSVWIYRDREAALPLPDGFFDTLGELLSAGDIVLANLGPWPFSQVGIFVIRRSCSRFVTVTDLSNLSERSTTHVKQS